jgi:peptidyl-prolyl cis-trans isomerase C
MKRRIGTWATKALREPLVHFLIVGAFIFALFPGGATDPAGRQIIVGEAQVARLAAQWEQTWRRQPSPAEFDGLIRDHIKEEVYYREALQLGLDRDDPIIRRRLRSKMEFLSTAQSDASPVDDTVLQTWLDRNPARYANDAVFSFDQIYVRNTETAAIALAQLKAGGSSNLLGEALAVPAAMEAAPSSEIDRLFGAQFATTIARLPLGTWTGPVESGFGSHLVRVRAVEATKKPKLADVRQQVENDWRNATRIKREERAYQALLDGYDIKIEKPR